MKLDELMNALGIKEYPEFTEELFEGSEKEYNEKGLWYIEEDFLKECHKKHNFFGRFEEEIMQAAAEIREDKYLGRYLAMMRYIITDCGEKAVGYLGKIPLPATDVESDLLKTELMPFFIYPPEADRISDFLQSKGFPEESVQSAIRGFSNSIGGFKSRFGRVGFERLYLVWCMHFCECKLFKLGALEFELKKFTGAVSYFSDKNSNIVMLGNGMTYHSSGNRLGNPGFEDDEGSFVGEIAETDEYYEGYKIVDGFAVNEKIRLNKSEYKPILRKGDNVINVHIPSGADLSDESVQKCFDDAEVMISRAFPDYNAKAFVCFSWLMDPVLKSMLKPSSKIVGFQNKYMLFPTSSNGKEVFIFLFKGKYESYYDLPQNTSLERAVRQYYIDGKHIIKFAGAHFSKIQREAFLNNF